MFRDIRHYLTLVETPKGDNFNGLLEPAPQGMVGATGIDESGYSEILNDA